MCTSNVFLLTYKLNSTTKPQSGKPCGARVAQVFRLTLPRHSASAWRGADKSKLTFVSITVPEKRFWES